MWPGAVSTWFSCKLNWKWLQPNNSIKVEGNYCIDCLTWRTIMVLVYYNWFSITLVLHRKVQIKPRMLKRRLRISTLPQAQVPLHKKNLCEQVWSHLCKKQKCHLHHQNRCVRWKDFQGSSGDRSEEWVFHMQENLQLWKMLQKTIKTISMSLQKKSGNHLQLITFSLFLETRWFRGYGVVQVLACASCWFLAQM